MTDLLLDSKIRVPRRRRAHVDRPRLHQRLDRLTDTPLTLVSAPAGFGKTTLLTEWLAADPTGGGCVAWFSLDPRDNDPAVFWRYLVGAVRSAAPDAGQQAHALVQAGHATTDGVLAVLLNDLGTLDHDLLVVLDDFHVVESAEVREQVTFFLEHLPAQVHVVIAARADPPLPLARWRARGDLVELRAADLRFTAEETAAYLGDVLGLPLGDGDLERLDARTEGWIAALQLAGLSMQGREDVSGFIAGFAGDDRFVVDYLVEEVLERQPDAVRRFLLRTSVLSRMEGSLCDAVLGADGSDAVLVSLERANLFVVPLDDRRHSYRYHHLFGDVLRARLLAEEPAAVPSLHHRASLWYEAHGDLGEAIRHASAGGDPARAADLLETALPSLRRARQEATLRTWIEAIPDDVLRLRPVLSVGYAGALMVRGELEGVERRLLDAERWLADPVASPDRSPDPAAGGGMVVVDTEAFGDLPGAIAVYRAGQALVSGDLAATEVHARRVLAVARADDHVARGSAAGLAGLARWSTGDLDEAHRWYEDSIAHLRTAGHLSDVLGCSLALADIQVAQGRLTDAMTTLGSGLRLGTEHDPPLRGTADMHVGLARLRHERDERDAARDHLRAAAELGDHAGLPQNAYRWRLETARLREADGDLVGALALLDEAEPVVTTDFSPDVRPLAAVRARLEIARGRLDRAMAWAQERGLTADDEPSYVREFEHLTLARVLLALGRQGPREHRTRAARLLDRLGAAAADGGRTGTALEVLALQALVHAADGDRASALAALRGAVGAAEPHGFVRVFLDEGAPMAALLRELVTRPDAPHHVHRLVGPAPAGDRVAAGSGTLPERLSARELEVLRLLTTDLDGPEIAGALVVSMNTVRTHTKNIYAKLGVNNRRAAVSRARELGLLTHAPAADRR